MTARCEYAPIQGFYDLRGFDISKKDFLAFVRVQKFLALWESARRKGQTVPDEIRELSAKYQQALFAFSRKPEGEKKS